MRNLAKVLVTTSALATMALTAWTARAQTDVDPPLPNVLLLVDTSGSMERTVAGGDPYCNPLTSPSSEDQKSRWTKLVEALTGPIQNFSCLAQPRTDTAFIQEYRLGSVDPYDKNYYIPFHRLLSNGCTKGPGPGNTIIDHYYTSPSIPCTTPWAQIDSGLLDTYRDRIRFSLMTFDTLTDSGTGISGGVADPVSGVRGMWSYFLGFQGGGTPAQGNPPNCGAKDQEVGARNPAAPEWEGPLIPFPTYTADITTVRANNDRIQNALLAMRPYGATPLAGMLTDARDYLLNDGSTWNGNPLGPRDDPYISGGCRKTSIVLISDGEPNLDLRPDCASATGPGPNGDGCPYDEPYVVAQSLNSNVNPNRRVQTFTVGFGLSTQAGIDCKTITDADFTGSGRCVSPTGPIRACCTLARVAIEGGTQHGYFPDDANELSAVMSQIFASIAANSTSRTLPVFATATATSGTSATNGVAFQFASSFKPPPSGALWSGNLERKRYVCETVSGTLTANLKDIDPTKGDDFAANVNSNDAAHPRKFFTVLGQLDSGANQIWSDRTIRPSSVGSDGLGNYTGSMTGSGQPESGSAFAGDLSNSPLALNLDPASPVPPQCSGGLLATTAGQCAGRITSWETGEPMPTGVATRDGNEFGSIYHSTPAVMGPPRDPIPDESYSLFATQRATRPIMLYTATTDGQMHALQVTAGDASDPLRVDQLQNNELWSFLPPAVLKRLLPTFNQQAILLDGEPVVKNVIFQRTAAQAKAAGTPSGASWHTVLLASGGAGGSYYYALDVTDPRAPQFLWQLSTDANGAPLFGATTPTPAIAMVQLQAPGGGISEVSVAILPGGTTTLGAGTCPRKSTITPLFAPTGTLSVRSSVRCWGAAPGGAVGPSRSVTIVRLDTGEVLRTFRGDASAAEVPAGLVPRTTVVNFDSPITGVPVPYPSQVGQVADRVYIGDADGTLWRINLANPDPNTWTVDLAWDAYSAPGDTATSGQPIQTTPIVSLDPLGNKVVLFSTGDQETFTAGGAINTRVWSLVEKPAPSGGGVRLSENWVIPFTNGKRVTGPISLFNGCAYFATFTPTAPGTYACADGFGSIYGVSYLNADAATPAAFPRACLVLDPLQPPVVSQDQAPGTIVFGVAVTQTPTCVETSTYSDPYFGAQTEITRASNAQYQLVFQTGAAGPQDAQKGETRTSVMTLPPPRAVVRIDSWASIVE